jgi:segregation and condensation protein B
MKTIDTTYNLKEVIKAVLFVAGDGVVKDLLAEKFELSLKELDNTITELKEEFSGEKGIHLIEYKNKIQFSTNPNFADYISDVLSPVREKMLTRAALETLAIIAYKQPITKLEIEDVRRVNSDYAVQALIDQDMIEIVGRKDAVGRPLMFGTTENFLKRFNIKNIEDLPDYESLIERIKLIRSEEEQVETRDTLFRNVDDFKFEDEQVPDFLADEEVDNFNGETDLA